MKQFLMDILISVGGVASEASGVEENHYGLRENTSCLYRRGKAVATSLVEEDDDGVEDDDEQKTRLKGIIKFFEYFNSSDRRLGESRLLDDPANKYIDGMICLKFAEVCERIPGQNGSHFEPRTVPPPLSKKCDWEIDPTELDFSNSVMIGKGDLHQYLKGKGALSPSTAVNFALDIARGMAYLHNEPNVVIHRDLKPRNVLLVNSSADHLKVGDFGLSKLIRVQNSHDVYKMTGETGSYQYMAPEVFKHRKYDKKVDVFTFAMILYEMLEGDPPLSHYEPYEAAKFVAEGHRPMFKVKGLTPELKDSFVQRLKTVFGRAKNALRRETASIVGGVIANFSGLCFSMSPNLPGIHRSLVEECWAKDVNKRPSFLEILKTLEKIKQVLTSDNHWNIFT
ncbi:putative transmembrane emp24 domain-containing protein p24delta7-like [Capsicum annuum]|nr:putative transmembrane emp24 domain-containing protein p24delta7-like [Capsicum annuum]